MDHSSKIGLRKALARGAWPWRYRTMLAPMEGVTHPELRDLVSSYGGVGVVCTEFVRITKTPLSRRVLARKVIKTSHAALSVQVMGNDLHNMAKATELVVEAGADVVDINLGCPAPNAVRKGVGSAMLKDPEFLYQVVSSMRERTAGPLSAKMRAGFASSDNALELAQVLEAAGVDFIVVHPRRQSDQYRGHADHRIVGRIKSIVRVPVVANGDLWHAGHARRVLEETQADALMLGRPALRNPWIFQQLKALADSLPAPEPDGDALLSHVAEYIRRTRAAYPKGCVGLLKEQLSYLLKALRDPKSAKRALLRLDSCDAILQGLETLVAGVPASELDLGVEARWAPAA